MASKGKDIDKQLDDVLSFLLDEYDIAPKEILSLIDKKAQKKPQQIPISAFRAPLSCLETITCYLRENKAMSFSQMGKMLGRDQRALSTTYRNARKKWTKKIPIRKSPYTIPSNIITNRKLSVLENVVFYLKSVYKLTNSEIALALDKDPRTIWTVLSRIKKKRRRK